MSMIRDVVKKHYIGMNQEFRHRGEEPGRLENFSDAVFALAITLLLISTSPPTTFEQIKRFKVLEREFSLENGEITPTMKLRRGKVLENFKAEISELYVGREEI